MDDICGSYLSSNKIKVDHRDSYYVGTDYGPFVETDYYQEYISKTVYMEPKYKPAYELSPLLGLKQALTSWRREPGDWNVYDLYHYMSKETIEHSLDFRKFIANHGCENAKTLNFIINLHDFITDNWGTGPTGGPPYIVVKGGTERIYGNAPQSFSPDFVIPEVAQEITFILDETAERQGLAWVIIGQLAKHWYHKSALKKAGLTSFPEFVQAAIAEDKYYVASCTYNVKGSSKN